MWHCHILDVANYCHDMMLLCGHFVGHNPDGALEQQRDENTRALLKEHFGSRFDEEVWNHSPDLSDENEGDKAMKSGDTSNSNDKGTSNLGLPITLSIQSLDGERVKFKVLRTTEMKVVFRAYAARIGMFWGDLRFFDGELVGDWTLTPDDLEFEDGDVIYCMLGQSGC